MPETSERTPEESCTTCHKPKGSFKNASPCGICHRLSCKECSQFLVPDSFSFLEKIPEYLTHGSYCLACYEEKVLPELANYAEAMERAKHVYVFYKKHEYLRVIRRSRKMLKVAASPDRKEALLRLAFFAAQQGFNALLDVELIPEKVRNFGYQKSNWTGTGFPADVKPDDEVPYPIPTSKQS